MHEELITLLHELDKMGPDDIAQYFMRLGIQGDHFPDQCPVANYLQNETADTFFVTKIAVLSSLSDTLGVFLPPNVAVFVKNFDAGRYPELEYHV